MKETIDTKYAILCIDDNPNNLFTLNALLSKLENVEIIEALSAKEGLAILLKKKIDLILCDVQMPEINGFEFARIIKSSKKTRDIPVVFVTAIFKSEEFIKEGFEIGAVDYITKPIDDNQLLNKLKLYIKIFQEKNKLLQSKQHFQEIAQSIEDGIYTLDSERKVTFINKKALELLGYSQKELLGKEIHNYIHYKDKQNSAISSEECNIHKMMKEGGEYQSKKDILIKKDGTLLPVSIKATPLLLENKIVGSVVIFHDRTKEEKIKDLEAEKIKTQEQIIHSMVNMIESRDSYTAGHTKRVAQYSVLIAQKMRYSQEEIDLVRNAAWLHDIGKISTPDNVLLKPGKLNNIEYSLIKEHLNAGYNLLKEIDAYKTIAEIMREHHEHYDGSGYPQGLKGDEIQPLSRIMIVADAFDAMTTNRVYKKKKTIEVALAELQELRGKHFHPEVVDAALDVLVDVELDASASQLPTTTIEQERFAYFYRDRLTNLFVYDYLALLALYDLKEQPMYVYTICLHNFSLYNKKFSWKQGDVFLIDFARFLEDLYIDDFVFRIEGDDFMLLSFTKLEDIEQKLKEFPLLKGSKVISVSVEEKYVNSLEEML